MLGLLGQTPLGHKAAKPYTEQQAAMTPIPKPYTEQQAAMTPIPFAGSTHFRSP